MPAGPAKGAAVSADDAALAATGPHRFAGLVAATTLRLDDVLADYPSARFKDVSFGYRDGKQVICGLYNGKNRMGAYAGWAVFYAFSGPGGRVEILNFDARPAFTYSYHCGNLTAWLPGDWSSVVAFKPKP